MRILGSFLFRVFDNIHREALNQIGIFKEYFINKGGGRSGIPKILCEILVAMAFGLVSPTFLAKSDIFNAKCTEGGRQFRNISKKYQFSF